MSRKVVSQRSFLRISQNALAFLCLIIVSGALVRLTGSGLGCVDWPGCTTTKFVDVSSGHSAIEQINRLFTGVVSAAVIAAVLGSFFVVPRRRSLIWLSSGLVFGVLVQIALGAIVVLTGLNPWSNMAHFLVSMGLVTIAVFLLEDARFISPEIVDHVLQKQLSRCSKSLVIVVVGLCGTAIVLGTLVTGTGPHAGDEDAVRFSLAITSVTRLHSAAVLLCIGTALLLVARIRKDPFEWAQLHSHIELFLLCATAQGALGYLQYFSGIPAQMVALHVAMAVGVWICSLRLLIAAQD